MKWVVKIVGGLLGLITILALLGLALPKEHVATSRIRLKAAPDTVYAVLRNYQATASWWPEVTAVTALEMVDGREHWREETGMGPVALFLTEERRPELLRTTIDTAGGSPFGGEWRYEIRPTAEGSELSITENGWVSNPLFRVIGRVMGHHGTIDSYLTALARHFNEPVRPEHVNHAE